MPVYVCVCVWLHSLKSKAYKNRLFHNLAAAILVVVKCARK